MASQGPPKTYYSILGVTPSADRATIKKAYSQLAIQYHPDKQPHAQPEQHAETTAKFRAVQEAWETLSDPQLRATYDERMKAEFLGLHSQFEPTTHSHHQPQPRRSSRPQPFTHHQQQAHREQSRAQPSSPHPNDSPSLRTQALNFVAQESLHRSPSSLRHAASTHLLISQTPSKYALWHYHLSHAFTSRAALFSSEETLFLSRAGPGTEKSPSTDWRADWEMGEYMWLHREECEGVKRAARGVRERERAREMWMRWEGWGTGCVAPVLRVRYRIRALAFECQYLALGKWRKW